MPDLATEIFGDSREAWNNIVNPAETSSGNDDATKADTEPQQGVEGENPQGEKQSQPVTPGEEAKKEAVEPEKEETKDATKPEDKGNDKAAANLRKWGEDWKQTAETHEKQIKEKYEPLAAKIDEKFGGEANLELAAEIYTIIRDEESFDPDNAMNFLMETAPGVAGKLVNHIAQEVVDHATNTALKRTFGRELSEEDINNITGFLALGSKAPGKFQDFLKTEDLPEEMLVDANGNRLPDTTIDFMRAQQKTLKDTLGKFNQLESRLNAGDQQKLTDAANLATQEYVTDTLSPIDSEIAKLGLHEAFEGETSEQAAERQLLAEAIEILSLGYAGKDSNFQGLYTKALSEVARKSTSKVAVANAVDYSLRLKKFMGEFAERASKVISPLIKSYSDTRTSQVAKTKATRAEITTPSSGDEPEKRQVVEYGDDPFDKASIHAQVNDIRRAANQRGR